MTNSDSALQELRRRVLSELETDDVGLWSVVLNARSLLHLGPGEVQDVVLSLLRDLLERREVVVGFPTRDGAGFEVWRISPSEAVLRVDREWSQLGRDPDIGEITWVARAARPRLEYVD